MICCVVLQGSLGGFLQARLASQDCSLDTTLPVLIEPTQPDQGQPTFLAQRSQLTPTPLRSQRVHAPRLQGVS